MLIYVTVFILITILLHVTSTSLVIIYRQSVLVDNLRIYIWQLPTFVIPHKEFSIDVLFSVFF